MERVVCHLNVIGFRAAVAAVKDKSLKGKPYVIAGTVGGRSLAVDCSPEAIKEGVAPGTAVAVAERKIKGLAVLVQDFPAYETANAELEKVASYYAPLWENDHAGNLYLDLTGTARLWGPAVDCSSRILKDIFSNTEMRPAVAVATNKLVGKVATRAIRPEGLIQVKAGTEADFMSHQDIRLLPGMGPGLLRTASVVGMREIGEIASLSVQQAISLFGRYGPMLRTMAQGIDGSPILEKSEAKKIVHRADFNEDIIEGIGIKAAIETLAEGAGLEMRRAKLGASAIKVLVMYADGVEEEAQEKLRRVCVIDSDIYDVAEKLYKKAAVRRVRVRSIALSLEALMPLGYEVDLFEPETDMRSRKLQEAVDKIQNRYGLEKVARGRIALGIRN